jgi:stage II sporulation protein D
LTFVAGVAAVATVGARAARSQTSTGNDEYDPAMTAATPSLRVLLGSGNAVANPGGGFTYQGRLYRGSFTRTPAGDVVNLVTLESYLYSVVPHEMSPAWPAAALQAQAVCARTYVLARSNPRRDYDLVPSEADQVYSGVATESAGGRSAVDATAGWVLRYGNRSAQAVYSSCCGGHTEASSDAWGGAPVAYLGGVVCPHCTASPHYRWRQELALSSVASAFADQLAPYGNMRQIIPGPADASGRLRTVELRADGGSAIVKGSVFRASLGPRVVQSLLITKIEPAGAPDRVALEGGGLGHGVGLCQWGARGMALGGASSSDILSFYFPGTTTAHE